MSYCKTCGEYTEHIWGKGECLYCYMGKKKKGRAKPDKNDAKLTDFIRG